MRQGQSNRQPSSLARTALGAPVRLQEPLHHITNTRTSPPRPPAPPPAVGVFYTWTVSIHPVNSAFACCVFTNLPFLLVTGLVQVHLSHHHLASTHPATLLAPLVRPYPASRSLRRALYRYIQSLRASPGAHCSIAQLPSSVHQLSTSIITPPLPKHFPVFLVALCFI